MQKIILDTIEEFRKEFPEKLVNNYFDDDVGLIDQVTRNDEIENFLKQALTKSFEAGQKSREKELEPIIEVVEAIADGSAFSKENGLIWQHWIDESKKRVESLSLTKDSK